MSEQSRQLEAAARLEQLSSDLAKAAELIRNHAENGGSLDVPYGMVYNLRRELGYVVASLGVGVPRRIST